MLKLIFEDSTGKILMPEEVDELSNWEIDDHRLHVFEEQQF
jgi:hypothetical protein